MITAGARTNAAGYSVTGATISFGGCQTDHFKVHPSGRGSSYFCKEDLLRSALDYKDSVLGDLLGSENDIISIIAESMVESMVSLRAPCKIMEYTPAGKKLRKIEVWTKNTRLKCIRGRVYGHKRIIR